MGGACCSGVEEEADHFFEHAELDEMGSYREP